MYTIVKQFYGGWNRRLLAGVTVFSRFAVDDFCGRYAQQHTPNSGSLGFNRPRTIRWQIRVGRDAARVVMCLSRARHNYLCLQPVYVQCFVPMDLLHNLPVREFAELSCKRGQSSLVRAAILDAFVLWFATVHVPPSSFRQRRANDAFYRLHSKLTACQRDTPRSFRNGSVYPRLTPLAAVSAFVLRTEFNG